jgi:hypothetical protein
LGDVDAAARDVLVGVDVGDAIDRPGVHAHPQRQVGPIGESLRHFDRAPNRILGTAQEHQRHPVARRERDDLIHGLCLPDHASAAHDLLKIVQQPSLVLHRACGVADDVDEEDVSDVQPRTTGSGQLVGGTHP